jgi:hypothetical protein
MRPVLGVLMVALAVPLAAAATPATAESRAHGPKLGGGVGTYLLDLENEGISNPHLADVGMSICSAMRHGTSNDDLNQCPDGRRVLKHRIDVDCGRSC